LKGAWRQGRGELIVILEAESYERRRARRQWCHQSKRILIYDDTELIELDRPFAKMEGMEDKNDQEFEESLITEN